MADEDSKKRSTPDDAPLEDEQKTKKIAVEEKKDDESKPADETSWTNIEELSSRFPLLSLGKDSSVPFLGLYFAASWCPDVQAATPAVDEFAAANKKDVTVAYVSSDTTKGQMQEYVPSSMAIVPFENEEDRSKLKRHFGVCAAKEREPLGMTPEQRKFGIPTLIVLEKATGKIITTDGVDDIVKGNGESVVEKWRAMLKQ